MKSQVKENDTSGVIGKQLIIIMTIKINIIIFIAYIYII